METIFWLGTVSVLGGLTLLSWKHPERFKRIAIPMVAVLVLALLFVSVYNFGGIGANVSELLEEVSKSQARTAVVTFYANQVSARYHWQLQCLAAGGTIIAYLTALLVLPGILSGILPGILSGRPAKKDSQR